MTLAKLTSDKQGHICAILAVGGTRTVAARYVGCHVTTIRRTALREPEFAVALEKAEAQIEIGYLSRIDAAARESRNWRAAAWVLERKYPDRYARRRPHTLSIDQLTAVLAQFADVLLDEAANEPLRQRVSQRLDELYTSLQAEAIKQEQS